MQNQKKKIPGWVVSLLWTAGLGGFCFVCLQLSAKYLLCDLNKYITGYNAFFSLLTGLFAAKTCRKAPVLLGGFCVGLFGGLIYMANSFEKSTLGSYGIIGLFLFLAAGLALGGIGEGIFALVKKKRAKARREEFLARLLYKK